MNTFEVIDVLNKGGVIEKGKTQYSIYQGIMIATKGQLLILKLKLEDF